MISKRPDLPANFSELIQDFSEICFLPDQLQPVDVVFAFGTTADNKLMADHLSSLYSKGISNNYILTGKASPSILHIKEGETEAEMVYKNLPEKMRHEANVMLEKTSTNSTENIQNSLEFLTPYKNGKVGCVARSWASRQLYHFKRFLPETEIVFLPFDGMREDGVSFTAANWHENEDACKRIWGEILRFKEYGEKGYMAYPDDLRTKIDTVFTKIKP